MNGAGINKICRMITPAGSGRTCGVSRVYDRIFWLEKTLLAFEREQLRRWRERLLQEARPPFHHLAHDDVVLGINWETAEDRRITHLNCAVTADVRSGDVFRVDVDFDPSIDQAGLIEVVYGPPGHLKNLRARYTPKTAAPFTAPLLSTQRPTGRFDERHLFAAALKQYEVFKEETLPLIDDSTEFGRQKKATLESEIEARIAVVDTIHQGYFNFPQSRRDRRTPFSGIMTRDTYTKGAHFVLLREMLPPGPVRLVTEMEPTLPHLLPHVFEDLVRSDDFTWLAMSFDKDVSRPVLEGKIGAFKAKFANFTWAVYDRDPELAETMTNSQFMRAFIAEKMETETKGPPGGRRVRYQTSNYQQQHMPQIWVKSPMQTAGEIDRVVGFPLVRKTLRDRLKKVHWATEVETLDQDTRERMARLVYAATLQPVSTFFGSVRDRLSPTRRAGGRSARKGPSYINGASFNPRVLVALLNIFRVYYNWFEDRSYVSALNGELAVKKPAPGFSKRRVPEIGGTVDVKKKASKVPVMRSPAMRAGIQEDCSEKAKPPSIYRVLYRPWIYANTPLWEKFENPDADLREKRGRRASPGAQAPNTEP